MDAQQRASGAFTRGALGQRVLRDRWVVLAGGSAGARRRLLRDELDPFATPDGARGHGYRVGVRKVTVVSVDLRHGGLDALLAALSREVGAISPDAPPQALAQALSERGGDARLVLVLDGVHAILGLDPTARQRLTQSILAIANFGRDVCVVLAMNGAYVTQRAASCFEGQWGLSNVIWLPRSPWPRRAMGVAAAMVATLAIGWVQARRARLAELRQLGVERRVEEATLPRLIRAMSKTGDLVQQRALAVAAASLELRWHGGHGEGVWRLLDDRAWNWAQGPWELPSEGAAPRTVRYLPDGTLFVGGPGVARVVDDRSGQVLRRFPVRYDSVVVTLSRDLRRVLTSDGEAVSVWDLTTGRRLFQHASPLAYASLSGDGSRVAVTERYGVFVAEVESGQVIARGTMRLMGKARLSDDGAWLRTSEPLSQTARVEAELRWSLTDRPMIEGLFSPLFNQSIHYGENEEILVDARGTILRHLGRSTAMGGRVSADGRRFLASGLGHHVFDAQTGERLLTIPTVTDALFGMDDRAELVLGEGPLGNGHVWSVAAGQRVTALPSTPQGSWVNLSTHPADPSTFVRADGIGPLSRWRRSPEVHVVGAVRLTLDRAPEGEILFPSARLVDAEQVEVFQVPTGQNPRWICFDALSGRRHACDPAERSYQDHTAQTGPTRGITALGADRALRIDPIDHLSARMSLIDPRSSVLIAPLGRTSDTSRHFLATRIVLSAPRALSVRLSPDRSHALHVYERGVIRVWETREGRHLQSLAPSRGGNFVDAVFSRDNRWIVTLTDDGWVEHWRVGAENPSALLANQLAATNLRVCRDDLRVVVVPDPHFAAVRSSPWAPREACVSSR